MYTDRKPIYDAFKVVIQPIIDKATVKEYAEAEIESIEKSIAAAFKEIRQSAIMSKDWTK